MAGRDDTRSPALTVICEVCGETLQQGSSGQTETVVCGRCHDARERRVRGVQETIRRVGAERYVAARLPYVVGRIMEEVGR